MGLRSSIDPSSEPKPPGRTVLDWVGIVLFGLLGTPLVFVCATTLFQGIFYTRAGERLFVLIGSLICVGLPGGLFWWRAWRIYSGRRFKWRNSMRGGGGFAFGAVTICAVASKSVRSAGCQCPSRSTGSRRGWKGWCDVRRMRGILMALIIEQTPVRNGISTGARIAFVFIRRRI